MYLFVESKPTKQFSIEWKTNNKNYPVKKAKSTHVSIKMFKINNTWNSDKIFMYVLLHLDLGR